MPIEISIYLSEDRVEIWKTQPGRSYLDWLLDFPSHAPTSILGIIAHNRILDLRTPLYTSCDLVPIGPTHREYLRLFQQNLTTLFFAAAHRVNPSFQWKLGHSLANSLYLEPLGFRPLESDISLIATQMVDYCQKATPFLVEPRDYHSAVSLLNKSKNTESQGDSEDEATVLESMNETEVLIAEVDGYLELALSPLAIDASPLLPFSLEPYSQGALLRYPRDFSEGNNSPIPDFVDIPFLSRIYNEHQGWSRILGVPTVGQLNRTTRSKAIKEYIWTAEALQAGKINDLAQKLGQKGDELRAIFVAGPSSSGKTTFAKRLSIQLQAQGIRPKAISLDNFFLPREITPRQEDGNYDFETFHALDLVLLNETLLALLNGEKIALPSFDFRLGNRFFPDPPERLSADEVLIFEGIHGLNPELLSRIPGKNIFKIYISALTQINIDHSHRISTTDNRLIRRIVRDYRYRGRSAESTIDMWPSVRRGEDRWIFPFQTMADGEFNSALDYELGVLKPMIESLLRQVKPGNPAYTTARRLLGLLNYFLPIPREFVPDMSILREFIGGSAFRY